MRNINRIALQQVQSRTDAPPPQQVSAKQQSHYASLHNEDKNMTDDVMRFYDEEGDLEQVKLHQSAPIDLTTTISSTAYSSSAASTRYERLTENSLIDAASINNAHEAGHDEQGLNRTSTTTGRSFYKKDLDGAINQRNSTIPPLSMIATNPYSPTALQKTPLSSSTSSAAAPHAGNNQEIQSKAVSSSSAKDSSKLERTNSNTTNSHTSETASGATNASDNSSRMHFASGRRVLLRP